jgi:hypothetical protein
VIEVIEELSARPLLAYRGRIELEDFLAYMKIVERLQISKSIRVAVWCLSLFLTMFGALAMWLTEFRWDFFLFLLATLYYVLWPIHHPLYLRWQYRRRSHIFEDTDIVVTNVGVSMKERSAEHLFRWDSIKLVVDAAEGIVLCNAFRQGMAWIPQRAFTSGGSKADVLATAARHGAKIERASHE